MVAFSCLHRRRGVGTTCHTYSSTWKSEKLSMILTATSHLPPRLNCHSELMSSSCPHGPKKGVRWRPDTGPFPAPDASSCSCFFLPGNPQSEPKQLANDDVFPNGIHAGGCLLSLGSYCQMHLLSYASSQCRSWIHSHKMKLSITYAQHREDCKF